jgi:hypothetical protein
MEAGASQLVRDQSIMDHYFKVLMWFSAIFFPLMLIQVIKLARGYVGDERRIYELETEYAQLVRARNEMINHYYWALESEPHKNQESLKKEIVRSTRKLKVLRNDFRGRFGRKGKKVD